MSNLEFVCAGETISVSSEKTKDGFKVKSGNKEFLFIKTSENLYQVITEEKKYLAAVVRSNSKYYIDIDSMLIEVSEPQSDSVSGSSGGHAAEKDKIYAPMPGKIVKIQVAVGDEVTEKQQMVVVEAMKMENQVIAQANGVVKAINFAEGDQVDTESVIIELDIEE